jgi:DNA repair exonuclease SbcCD ATPase subunit
MIPISITLKGFLSYRDEQTLDFEGSHLWMLTGKNGAGKSTVFDAIRYALYGVQDRGSKFDIIHADRDSCSVSLVFEARGKRYRAERKLKRGGQPVPALYEDGNKTPINDTTLVGGFDKAMQGIIGLSDAAFTWAAFLRQGRAEALIDALRVNTHGNSDAYELLKQIKDLAAYEAISMRAEDKHKEAKSQAATLRRSFEAMDPVTDAEIAEAEQSVIEATTQIASQEAERKAIQDALGKAGEWESLTGRQASLSADLERLGALLAEPDQIRQDATRHAFLSRLIPLRQKEEDARVHLVEAEGKVQSAKGALAALPTANQLREWSERVRTASAQLPHLRQRDGADKELRRLRKQEAQLAEETARLLDRTKTAAVAREAEAAKFLHPHLATLERAHADQAKTLAVQEKGLALSQELRTAIAEDDAALASVRRRLEGERANHQAALTARSERDSEFRTSEDALKKREATRGSNTCAYCGQTISLAQWATDFAQAEAAVRNARNRLEEAQTALDAAETALDGSGREEGAIGNRLDQAKTRRTKADADLEYCESRLQGLAEEIRLHADQIPADNALTAAQAKEKAAGLTGLQETLDRWREADEQERNLSAKIQAQDTVRQQALSNLPSDTLAAAVAEEWAAGAADLRESEDARQEADREWNDWNGRHNERHDAWKRAQGELPDSPDCEQPIAALEEERNSLNGAPARLKELENADRDSDRIQDDLNKMEAAINALPEASRRPVATLNAEISQLDTLLEEARTARSILTQQVRQLADRRERRGAAETAMVEAENRAELWKVLDKQLGQPLQNWLLKEAEGEILRYANGYLDSFSQGNLSLEIRSGSSVPLDLVCRNDSLESGDASSGKTLPLTGLSGSQKFRVAVSLALAFGQFASQDSQRIQSVIIDEGFGGLDADGQREMSSELQVIACGLARLIVVSHQETFADVFNNRYHIRLVNGSSHPERQIT